LAALHAADRPLTAPEVQRAVVGDLAYTTVLTILSRSYAEGLAARVPPRTGLSCS
jgi:hypothetical protein